MANTLAALIIGGSLASVEVLDKPGDQGWRALGRLTKIPLASGKQKARKLMPPGL